MNNTKQDQRNCTLLTKRLVVNCIRNSVLEDFHAGKTPVSHTGDDSDVRVIDANGTEFGLNERSRISDVEMKELMQSVTNRIYTFLLKMEDADFMQRMSRYDASISNWDAPKTDPLMTSHATNKADSD
ncbi:hypothetical protein [uncultured Roseobacter sp.]|uniref:hypothetical protein n=1 Tax=uncultured Roseobacter sp. TaxID=114847 RepID=UPI00262C11CA|nr:hypothetical protein [uncultured Roseobacter sp.]